MLRIFLSFFLVISSPVVAYALEDVPPAVPPPVVQAQALPLTEPSVGAVSAATTQTQPEEVISASPHVRGYYVLELFSTQACTFCPKADGFMKAYADYPHVIALSCHVDYFDVKEASFSRPECTARQKSYEKTLNVGPKFTPQMVVNGDQNAIGYSPASIQVAFNNVRKHSIPPFEIERIGKTEYRANLPDIAEGAYDIWAFLYDKPKTQVVRDGGNAGKRMTYYNVVSKAKFLGDWHGASKQITFETKVGENTKGIAILVQRKEDNTVVLASKVE